MRERLGWYLQNVLFFLGMESNFYKRDTALTFNTVSLFIACNFSIINMFEFP